MQKRKLESANYNVMQCCSAVAWKITTMHEFALEISSSSIRTEKWCGKPQLSIFNFIDTIIDMKVSLETTGIAAAAINFYKYTTAQRLMPAMIN